jgi:anti-sigma B factor antagonist/stage II sporulation protein AA (anti-sigma F factor antagonist)
VSDGGVDDADRAALTVEYVGGDPFLVRVAGELDVGSAETFSTALSRLRQERHVEVILDVADLVFVDSQGLSALLAARREGNRFLLRQPRESLRRLIDITGLGEALPVERAT